MTGRGRANLYDRDGETSVGCISFFARRIFWKSIKEKYQRKV